MFAGTVEKLDVGDAPAPPPRTNCPLPRAADDAHPVALEKYGMPPEVPATVNASVPLVVIGEPETLIRPPVKLAPALVTVPLPAGVAHVPSPRQNVDDDAPVPLFRCVTPRLPVMSALKSTRESDTAQFAVENVQWKMPVLPALGQVMEYAVGMLAGPLTNSVFAG